MKAIIISKDKFIRDLGESKDEDARELELCKHKFVEFVEQNKSKVSQLMSQVLFYILLILTLIILD